jgi:phosphoserine aminotransferase
MSIDNDYGRKHNFSAGPGTLPLDVMLELRDELPVYRDVGSSIMEISHRSAAYDAVHNSAISRLRSLLGVGDEWHVLFLQGGASMQFFQVPYNFLGEAKKADYIVTGSWASKALKEAERLGDARAAASSKDRNFAYIPSPGEWNLRDDAAYLHFTSNNTIFGTQYATEPDVSLPLVCDVSSDFLSRPISMDRYGLIYAGAQKNLGPAGVTVVMIRKDFLEQKNSDLATMLDYGTHVDKLFNTPPVFAVYMVEKVLRWIERHGDLRDMERRNEEKAQRLYDRIDRNEFYRGTADVDSRSRMNVTFRLGREDLEKRFISEASDNGLLALKGHRSVGGIRASIYNACEPASVDALISFMDEFERHNG